jgi:hypothetical protein
MKSETICRPFLFVAVLTILSLNFVVTDANAADRRDPIHAIDKLMRFPLKAPVKMVQNLIQDRLRKETRSRIKAQKDPYRRDELKRELQQRLRTIQESYIEFTGQSKYDHSVITGEFRHNAGDALLRESRGQEDLYYFFQRGRIWKIIATLDPYYDLGSTILRLIEQYGTPSILEFKGGSPSNPPARAYWETEHWILEIADRRSDFGCYTVVRARKELWNDRVSDRGEHGGGRLNPLIEEVIGGDSGGEDASNIVDEILKRNQENNTDNEGSE